MKSIVQKHTFNSDHRILTTVCKCTFFYYYKNSVLICVFCNCEYSRYDHLLELLCRILADRPKDPYAIFEAYSQKVKNEIFNNETESFRNVYLPPSDYEHAKKLIEFFKVTNLTNLLK